MRVAGEAAASFADDAGRDGHARISVEPLIRDCQGHFREEGAIELHREPADQRRTLHVVNDAVAGREHEHFEGLAGAIRIGPQIIAHQKEKILGDSARAFHLHEPAER